MENQVDYSSLDFEYDFEKSTDEDKIKKLEFEADEKQDILEYNSTKGFTNDRTGLKPTREIIRGSVVYDQDGNNN